MISNHATGPIHESRLSGKQGRLYRALYEHYAWIVEIPIADDARNVGEAYVWCYERHGKPQGRLDHKPATDAAWGHWGALFFFHDKDAAFEFKMVWG